MVVAIALATTMVIAIYSTTQAMSATARRQQAASRQDARFDRFLEILRRDLQGIVWKQGATQNATQPREDPNSVLLSFETTTDSLIMLDTSAPRRRSVVRYSSQPVEDQFQIVRSEGDGQGASGDLSLLRLSSKPRIEWWSGGKWVHQDDAKDRPTALRLVLDSESIVLTR
jgi:hypothetical protein